MIATDAPDHHLPVVFDFVIDGKLLRVPLQSFIERHRLSTEHIIVVTYFPAVRLSDEGESVEAPSWVGSIDSCMDSSSGAIRVVAGCFNGQLKLYLGGGNESLSEVATVEAHDEPIRSVLTWMVDPSSSSSEQCLLTASKDKTIKLWRCTRSGSSAADDRQQVQLVTSLRGHLTSVESLSRCSSFIGDVQGGGGLLSGDWSGNIFAWNLLGLLGPSSDNNSSSSRSANSFEGEEEGREGGGRGGRVVKKSKTGSHSSTAVSYEAAGGGAGTVGGAKPVFSLRAHSQCVSGIEVLQQRGAAGSSSSSMLMLTCSWDHSWKAWDLERQDCISTCVSSRVFTSMHVRSSSSSFDEVGGGGGGGKPLVLTSHPDGKCRLWDLDSNSSKASFGRSSDWISQVGRSLTHSFIHIDRSIDRISQQSGVYLVSILTLPYYPTLSSMLIAGALVP